MNRTLDLEIPGPEGNPPEIGEGDEHGAQYHPVHDFHEHWFGLCLNRRVDIHALLCRRVLHTHVSLFLFFKPESLFSLRAFALYRSLTATGAGRSTF